MSTTSEAFSHDVPRDTLATRVMIARHERHLSQRAAAEMCGLTFGEWQGIESGRRSGGLDRKVEKIAKGLRYDRNWLMWGGPLAGEYDTNEDATTSQYLTDSGLAHVA